MQQLNPSEISELIKERIANLDTTSEARTEGTIVSVSDGIVRIHGLADVMYGEMIEFTNGVYGMALNLEHLCKMRALGSQNLSCQCFCCCESCKAYSPTRSSCRQCRYWKP